MVQIFAVDPNPQNSWEDLEKMNRVSAAKKFHTTGKKDEKIARSTKKNGNH